MKSLTSCGVIVEYNPLHNGHRYHLENAKQKSKADVMVAVMSGNFVQRGEPAILSKQVRTRLALEAGADLVVELPWYGAVQSADYFAKASIDILQALQVDSFCFGTDTTTAFDYQSFALLEQDRQAEMDAVYQEINHRQPNLSYPRKMDLVYQRVFPEVQQSLAKPNHILGLSYARYNVRYPRPMSVLTVQRNGSDHHDATLHRLASGTAIRQAVFQKRWADIPDSLPDFTLEALQTEYCHSWDDYFPLLKAKCLTMRISDLEQIYQMVDGLEWKIKAITPRAKSMAEWVGLLKSKRYSYARLQRLATYILMDVRKDDLSNIEPYIRVLGMNQTGRDYLKQTSATLPVITNLKQQSDFALACEKKWDEVYLMATDETERFTKDYHPVLI